MKQVELKQYKFKSRSISEIVTLCGILVHQETIAWEKANNFEV